MVSFVQIPVLTIALDERAELALGCNNIIAILILAQDSR